MSEEKLYSKKNEVYKREREIDGKKRFVVEKKFSETKRFYMEYIMHDILAKGGLSVPRLLDFEPPAGDFCGKLVYEFLGGDIVLDVLSEKKIARGVIWQIIVWLGRFYEITSEQSDGERWILGDTHLRNFIYDREKRTVYGFDFEETEKGRIEQDIAKLFLYIASYEPAYSEWHMELAEYFLRESLAAFEIDKKAFPDEINNEAKRMGERRQTEIKTELVSPILERVIGNV